jgi:hypothetical protein
VGPSSRSGDIELADLALAANGAIPVFIKRVNVHIKLESANSTFMRDTVKTPARELI